MNKKIKYGCIVIIGLLFIGLAIALLTFPVLMQQAFGPTKETVEINQEVGGTLLCESEYNADLASWFYDVEYKYRTDSGEIIPIGRGEYYGQDWNKNEQILTWKNWHLLKTGGGFYSEKLLIGSLDKSNWNEFIFSPENIEKDSIWKSKRIASKMGWLPQRAKLRNWGNGIIQVDYLFRTGEEIEQQENRLITYELDSLSGIPEMIKIEND